MYSFILTFGNIITIKATITQLVKLEYNQIPNLNDAIIQHNTPTYTPKLGGDEEGRTEIQKNNNNIPSYNCLPNINTKYTGLVLNLACSLTLVVKCLFDFSSGAQFITQRFDNNYLFHKVTFSN